MRYSYIAVDSHNKKNTGTLTAVDQSEAVAQLQEKGLIALQIKNDDSSAKDSNTKLWEREYFTNKDIHKVKIKKKKQLTILQQMGIMMKAGVSLSLAMDVLIASEKDRNSKSILMEINSDLYNGVPISAAMGKFHTFPEIIINIVQSGETNGRLDLAFERCAQIVEKELEITSKLRGALGYPVFLLFLTLGLVMVLNVVVLPSFSDLFKSFGKQLPALTVAVMGVSNFLTTKWFIVIGILAIVIFGSILLHKQCYAFAYGLDKFWLKIPVIGTLLRQSYIARFSRIMSSLVASGVDIVRSLEISRDVIPNRHLKSCLTQVIDDVKIGVPINQAMAQFPVFDALLVSMLKVGEESGQLHETMEKLANLYEDQTAQSTKRLTRMMEPLMTIIIAVVVGIVIIS